MISTDDSCASLPLPLADTWAEVPELSKLVQDRMLFLSAVLLTHVV